METIVNSQKSLSEVNQSVAVPKNASFWRTLRAFIGPGALVAVGYMDPGNWITSVVGGATYKYLLLSVILVSSLIAMQLQQMAGKLGIVTRKDLAQAIAAHLPKKLRFLLFIIIELALMATDLAEVIGSGIALHLLFGWSLLFSILITILDVFILLSLMRLGFRKIEAIVSTLIATILIIFLYLVILSKPSLSGILQGYIPNAQIIDLHQSGVNSKLTLALGIIGATVMLHNLYLHFSISQTRKVDYQNPTSIKQAVRFMTWDSNLQLTVAFVVNSLLLILGASLFYGHASEISAFSQMYNALQDSTIAGAVASSALSTLFAIALLASGQNSTITGTLTGQIVMEGFLKLRLPQWLIRLVTRLAALLPVLIIAVLYVVEKVSLTNSLSIHKSFCQQLCHFPFFLWFISRQTANLWEIL